MARWGAHNSGTWRNPQDLWLGFVDVVVVVVVVAVSELMGK